MSVAYRSLFAAREQLRMIRQGGARQSFSGRLGRWTLKEEEF
jgi:hypothetical protein